MKQFNIRVYGILLNNKQEVLLSDELRHGVRMTKFPGGGMQIGEGIIDALKREFREELNMDIKINELFYLTDFFQASAFNKDHQLISIYYLIETEEWKNISTSAEKTFVDNQEKHRWVSLNKLKNEDITFPIDQLVAQKLSDL